MGARGGVVIGSIPAPSNTASNDGLYWPAPSWIPRNPRVRGELAQRPGPTTRRIGRSSKTGIPGFFGLSCCIRGSLAAWEGAGLVAEGVHGEGDEGFGVLEALRISAGCDAGE